MQAEEMAAGCRFFYNEHDKDQRRQKEWLF
jgi:hypothetical protein